MEAASLAGHLGLGKLIYLYDQNHITLAGTANLSFTEDVAARFDAVGWHVQRSTAWTPTRSAPRSTAAQAETEQPR